LIYCCENFVSLAKQMGFNIGDGKEFDMFEPNYQMGIVDLVGFNLL